MLKFIKWFLLILILLVIVSFIGIYMYLGSIVKYGVEKFIPPITGTPVTLERANISLLDGSFTIKGFAIKNPSGYTIPNAFSVKEIKVLIDMSSLLKNKIIIKDVSILEPMASIEVNSQGMNLNVINTHIQNYLASSKQPSSPSSQTEKPTSSKQQKSVIIKDLTFTDGKIELGALGAAVPVSLPTIHQTNIGEKSSKTIGQTIAEVLSIFSVESIKASTTAVLEAGKETLKNIKNQAQGIADQVKTETKNIQDTFKKIF